MTTESNNMIVPGAATIPAGTLQLDVIVSNMMSDFYSEFRKHNDSGNTAELKAALRSFLNSLEDFYRIIG